VKLTVPVNSLLLLWICYIYKYNILKIKSGIVRIGTYSIFNLQFAKKLQECQGIRPFVRRKTSLGIGHVKNNLNEIWFSKSTRKVEKRKIIRGLNVNMTLLLKI